jgi:hypothetical protein
MNTTSRNYKYPCLVSALILSFAMSPAALAQHEGHDMSKMPGMKMAQPKTKPKPKAKQKRKGTTRKKKPAAGRTLPAKKHDMSNMPSGMPMPGMPMPGMKAPHAQPTPSSKVSPAPGAAPHVHTPGMNMPGMQTPANAPSPNPQASPHHMEHMPGMQMPANAPSPNPQAPHQMDTNMPMPKQIPSPAPGQSHPQGHQPGAMGNMGMNTPNKPAGDSMKGMPGMGAMNMGPLMVMEGNDMGIRVGSSDTNIMSMGAMGSGTTWQPSSGPMHMHYKVADDWLLLFHYNLVAGLNHQGGPRGVNKAESANWFMPMAYHKLGKGTVQLRGMFSFEPFTFPPGGSPLLFQTGETYKGQPLIDKQHPHDLFMELSAQYTHPLGERSTWFAYFGYPGEPALGPVAFMHRMSASENSSATLSHHLQDSTHISFGVLTTGFTYRWLKLEGSIFNGREPDENRYNFDAHKWNSRSARLSIMPNKNWVMQASYGFLRSPEASAPDTDIRRLTASMQYNRPLHRGNWASAFIWGRNHTSSPTEIHNLNGYTFESTVNFLDKNYLYTRLELVDKDELLRAVDRARLGITDDHPSFRIGAYTFGGARDIWNSDKLSLAIGSDLTFYSKPAVLDQLYGSNPLSWKLFLRLRPGKMDMAKMHGTGLHKESP